MLVKERFPSSRAHQGDRPGRMGAPTRRGALGRATTARLAVVVVLFLCGCCCGRAGACLDVERNALLQLKHSINYPNGTALPAWGGRAGGGGCCSWPGVTCDNSTGRVIAVELPAERTVEQGTWHPNLTMLAHLRQLRRLDLSGNQIGGWDFAQAICEMKQLQVLDLGVNLLEGIPPPGFYHCLCQMHSLNHLFLQGNRIRGSLPPCLCNMSSLTELDLDNNGFQGRIPSCLGNLYSLQVLLLYNNSFTGSIPSSMLHNLTNLRWVSMGRSPLQGVLDFSVFANLSKLEYIHLSSEHALEIETESSSWVPSFQLLFLSIRGCTINRRSGHTVPSFISAQHRLVFLRLQDTQLAGRLPPWLFCNSSLYNLYLGRNFFHDMFPQPCYNSSSIIENLDISGNQIHGALPKNIGFVFPQLKLLDMAMNELEGQLPPSLGRTSLSFLDFGGNNLLGELPPDLTRNATMLEWLDLSNNLLEGEMLPRDSHIPSLKFLYLSGNRFQGSISPRISNSSLLRILDVGRNSLRCDLTSCLPVLGSGVSGLILRENFFQGHPPNHLCRMPYLQFLDISTNNLSGKIPACFNNISSWKSSMHRGLSNSFQLGIYGGSILTLSTAVAVAFTSKYSMRSYMGVPLSLMTGLDLSSNMLDGTIPSELGELKQLQALNLSNNHLRGSIPKSFGNLNSIESLDLSHNSLNGTIPHELARLNFLAAFSVAFNDLSGVIPSGGQFSSFNVSSYEENAGLCGPPLAQNCSSKNREHPGEVEPGGDGEEYGIFDNDKVFYSFVALSYFLGLWSFFAILLLNKRWRTLYFRTVDRWLS